MLKFMKQTELLANLYVLLTLGEGATVQHGQYLLHLVECISIKSCSNVIGFVKL